MTNDDGPRDALAELLRSATTGAAHLADVLRGIDKGRADGAQVGEWTLPQTMAHVVGTARLYRRVRTGWASPLRAGGLPTLNAGFFAAMIESEPVVLADLLEEATEAYATTAREVDPDTVCSWHLELQLDVATVTAFLGNELLMHGWDIAHALGETFVDEAAALPVVPKLAPVRASFAELRTPSPHARIGFQPEGGSSDGLVFTSEGAAYIPGGLEVDFDCLVTGPAFSLLLWSSGRAAWHEAGLSASGRQPALAESVAFLRA